VSVPGLDRSRAGAGSSRLQWHLRFLPKGNLVFDSAGNLYGATSSGGAGGYGTVFELIPGTGGTWNEKLLRSFNMTNGWADLSGLIFDASGNLYGTTDGGGGFGNVFELRHRQSGGWGEKVLYTFAHNGSDPSNPWSGLISDTAGNLYGTGIGGGAYYYGAVFELTPAAGGTWTETVLHSFAHNGYDGTSPYGGLVFDSAGNLYGTTTEGGAYGEYGWGTVYELSPAAGGGWTETVLHNFNDDGTDGTLPEAGLIVDASGNLYGTTSEGGAFNFGTVFELSPAAGGGWTETVLHTFNQDGTDGVLPYCSLILDASGNLYGTTTAGGNFNKGTVFELAPAAGGGWTETVLYSFHGVGRDGSGPYGGLVSDAAGNLYGTTQYGGIHSYGTVFEILH
jgi:uncharacterized repeat protein (TIGR03803 family)